MDGVTTTMEGVESGSPDLFIYDVLSKFSSSADEHHLHVCTAVGAMSQELKDQNLPLTPLAYFGATCSALRRLSFDDPDPPGHLVDALSEILALLLEESSINAVHPNILEKKFEYLSELLVKVIQLKSVGTNGIVSCLKCVERLLKVREGAGWSDLAPLYNVLIGYLTDDRTKVRKQSHVSLYEVLLYFNLPKLSLQGNSIKSPMLALIAPASDVIIKAFERCLLLAGGSNGNASEGSKGAQEVLHVLDALKLCLPFMSMKSTTSILKYFKTLLELRQPLVTRRITDGLSAMCRHPNSEVSAEMLMNLLCSLATSVSVYESSADSMTFTARLLYDGMKRVYALNRQICVVKLPVVFSSLGDILASEHEEALVAAMEAFKGLINECIDENLVKQGVDMVTLNTNPETKKSGPTVIEKVCATVESLLHYRYAAAWDLSFQVVSTMFDKLGEYSSYFLRGTLRSLAEMQELPDEDFPYKKQLHKCVGSAVGAMGPETFLSLLPLKLEAQDLSEVNVWLFPILKQYIVGAHLSFFTESILSMIGTMKNKSAVLEQEGKIHSARAVDGLVYSLWSLLPSFCNYPSDTAESFKDLEKDLCKALLEEPDVCGIICSSLQILIQQNKRIQKGEDNPSDDEISIPMERAMARYNPEVAANNLNTLKSSSRELLSVLSGVFLTSSKDTGGSLQITIGELASISDKEVVSRFFKFTMQKLLKVTQEAGKVENSGSSNAMQVDNSSSGNSLSIARAQLYDRAVSLLPGLQAKEIDLLFVAIQPALKDAEGLIQKKAYKVLSLIFQHSEEFISRRLEELRSLMIEALPSIHFSAKRHRLDCLYFLIVHVSKDESVQTRRDTVIAFLTEILLALKEVNKKTRNRAYDILVQIGHAFGDEEKGGNTENLQEFFKMVVGGLALETPHTISATVKGLARLAYEFGDLLSTAYNVIPSAILLLRTKNREIIKASLGLMKVLVAKSQPEGLHEHLRNMVEGLLGWQDSAKNHFRAKVKLLLGMLIKKCGLEAVKEVMPEEHMRLLTNIRKIKERRERALTLNSEDGQSHLSKATTSRLSRWNHTRIFSDCDDDENENSDTEYMTMKTVNGRQSKASSVSNSKVASIRSKRKRKAANNLEEDFYDQLDDEPLDLLDKQRTRSSLRSNEQLRQKSKNDDELEIDSEGRLIIHEVEIKANKGKKPQREAASDADLEEQSQEVSHLSASSQRIQKRRKTSEAGWAYTGKEYTSKRAKGDVKRKDKLEPYAYWPLDRKMMSRRPEQRAAARKGMASVVKLTKRLEGKSVSTALSMKGMKMKKGKNKSRTRNA